jgi:hypothetical protein
MPDQITYGSYYFPSPLPAIAESDNLIKVAGKYDHKSISVDVIGFLTGSNLSGLHLQKMRMISGFLDEYQDLTISIGSEQRIFGECVVNSIEFAEGDLTTILPYTVNLTTYENHSFSEYFGIEDPQNSWSYSEQDNKIIQATHTVSAKGVKINGNDPFDNARSFVTGKLQNGFEHISFFNQPKSSGFLVSRTEDIDRKNNKYGVTEVYNYSASDYSIPQNGLLTYTSSIAYSKNQQLSISINGSLQGSIDACINGGLLTTGDFTPSQATEIALNTIINSSSNFEQGVYSFVSNGPTFFDYTINTGSNKLDFSFKFEDPENLDLIGNVLHKYDVSIACSKDQAISNVTIKGSLTYNGSDLAISNTGEAGPDNARFLAIENALTGVNQFLLARNAFDDFISVATGYKFNSSSLNPEPISFSIQKNPFANEISYDYTYNNSIDYSSGQLKDFNMSIADVKPLVLTNVQESVGGFAAQVVSTRSLGQYSVNASANNKESDLSILKNLVSGYCSGLFEISNSQTIETNNITFNLSKYY